MTTSPLPLSVALPQVVRQVVADALHESLHGARRIPEEVCLRLRPWAGVPRKVATGVSELTGRRPEAFVEEAVDGVTGFVLRPFSVDFSGMTFPERHRADASVR